VAFVLGAGSRCNGEERNDRESRSASPEYWRFDHDRSITDRNARFNLLNEDQLSLPDDATVTATRG
jgi:hypothetical protein